MPRVRKAVIPAAGRGTRFLPATKAQPKEMLPIVDTPTIQFVVEEAVASGITDILIITGKDKRSIEDHFDRSMELEMFLDQSNKRGMSHDIRKLSKLAHIHYIRQPEQLGLGDAIMHARYHVADEPFAVLLGDTIVDSKIPCTRQLMNVFERYNGSVIGLERVEKAKVSRYGIVDGRQVEARTYALAGLVEKPAPADAPSRLAIGGRYVLTPDIFECLDKTAPARNGEIQLTDALRRQCRDKAVYGYRFDGVRYDIGNKVDYLVTQIEYALRRPDLRGGLMPHLRRIAGLAGGRNKRR